MLPIKIRRESMLKVAICHNSKIYYKFIEQIVKKYMDEVEEYEYLKTDNPNDILTWGRIDLLLIGIKFEEISGFEIVEKVRKAGNNVLIIFLDEDLYVFESIKYQPFRFIRKSHIEDLDEAVSSAVQKIRARRKEYVFQCSKSQIDSVDIGDILYFESQHNNVKLVAEKGEYKFRATIKSIEQQLYKYGFVRVHSGFL